MAIDPLLAQIMASVPTKRDVTPIAEPSVDQPEIIPPSAPTGMDALSAQPTGIFGPPQTPSATAPQLSAPTTQLPVEGPMTDAMFPEGAGVPAPLTISGDALPPAPTTTAPSPSVAETQRRIGAMFGEGPAKISEITASDPASIAAGEAQSSYERESAAREARLAGKLAARDAMRERARGGGEPELTVEERQAEAEAQLAESKAQAARQALQDQNLSEIEKIKARGDLIGMPEHLIRQGQAKEMGLDLLDEDVRKWIAGDSAQIPQGGEEKPSGETQGSTPATSTSTFTKDQESTIELVLKANPNSSRDEVIKALKDAGKL